jgi:hypothetical protein
MAAASSIARRLVGVPPSRDDLRWPLRSSPPPWRGAPAAGSRTVRPRQPQGMAAAGSIARRLGGRTTPPDALPPRPFRASGSDVRGPASNHHHRPARLARWPPAGGARLAAESTRKCRLRPPGGDHSAGAPRRAAEPRGWGALACQGSPWALRSDRPVGQPPAGSAPRPALGRGPWVRPDSFSHARSRPSATDAARFRAPQIRTDRLRRGGDTAGPIRFLTRDHTDLRQTQPAFAPLRFEKTHGRHVRSRPTIRFLACKDDNPCRTASGRLPAHLWGGGSWPRSSSRTLS